MDMEKEDYIKIIKLLWFVFFFLFN
jgi:hypothetical protein